MAFNFGAFLNGMSQSIVSSIEEEEKQNRRFELLEQEDAIKQRNLRKAERDKKQRVLEASISALTSLGFKPETAAHIAKQGGTAVDIAKELGIDALKTGHDVETFYRTSGVSENMIDAKNQINETIEGGSGRVGFQAGPISKMYEKPTETQNSFAATAAFLSQKMAEEGLSQTEFDALQARFDKNLENYGKWKAANPDVTSPLFDPSKAEVTVNRVTGRHLNGLKIDTDVETAISRRLDGDEGRYGVGLLRAANELQGTYGKFNDPIMKDKISILQNSAVTELRNYADRLHYRAGTEKNFKSTNYIAEQSLDTTLEGLSQSKYKIGDVITYKNDAGALKIIVYTGVPMNDQGDMFLHVR